MILIPLPDPIDHHALSLAKLVAATSWLSSANVVRAADENLSQVGGVVPTPKRAALAQQEICTDLIQSGISDVNPLTTEKRLWLDFKKCIVYDTKIP